LEGAVRLEGKVAIVTGAGGGIGRSVCEQFLTEGARVAALDLNEDAAADAVGADAIASERAIARRCDVGDPEQVRAAVRGAVSAFGMLTTLVNIAGGSTNQDARVTDAPEEEFWRAIRLDLFGTFLICKYGIPELISAGGGSVVNMTSMLAFLGSPGRSCYTSAKGGISSLTRSMATDYAPDSIRVNAIAPGLTLTPRVQARLESERVQEIASRHLLGPCHPLDIAHMAVYLAADESRIVTGQVLQVDSGVTIH
jgi:NAD(P)-dependent dehydrogenase (short-subunit alcohol dehydrogenase family)